ncbi:hypothetical protein PG996_011522 [Apiospora saccharicola]|uniref:Rhodopsin domain-containing protein n=1 Tax=Apiospora saccharicola TaxID=335842 RepID=A0ABR1UFB3_9PEZI
MADGVDIPNRGPELQAVCIALLALAVTATALRCYTRIFILRAFGLDDGVMVFATVSFALFTSSSLTGVHYGTGRHHSDLDRKDIQEAMKYWWFCYIWYCVTMIASKISIGVFLLRITIVKAHKWIIYVVLFLSVITGIVFFFVTLLQCQPLYYFWDKDQPGTCLPPSIIAALTYLYSAFSVLCDFTFALLPLHMIMGLQMRQSIKYSLVPILGMACVCSFRASIAVVVRFVFVHTFEDPDFLWATLDIAIWSDVEQGLAICAGCLATLQPLIKRTAQSVGLWSIHTGVGASGSGMPPQTIGSMDRHKAARDRAARDNGNFTLATFQRVSEDSAEDLDLEGNHRRGGGGESKIGVTSGPDHGGGDDDNKSIRNNKAGIFTTTTVTVKKEAANHGGNGLYNHFDDSEEHLTHKSSKDMMEEGGPRISPRSPLDSIPPHKRG